MSEERLVASFELFAPEAPPLLFCVARAFCSTGQVAIS